MSEDYRSMWKDLGLDLVAHDALLGVLGKFYQDIYLAQKNRPEGMGYFDFVMSEVHGLRIKELLDEKKAGRKVIGTYCVFVPEEIVLAGNATMVGLCAGADFAMEEVEKILPRNTCALIKSTFGFKLGKVCPYLEASDMIVGENTCDGKKKAYESLGPLVSNLYVMDIPQMKSTQGWALLKGEYLRFKQAVEKLTGVKIDAAALKQAIETVNNKRQAIHRLSKLRQADPAPISGLDALLANQVFFYDNPQRFTDSVNKICDELEKRVAEKKGVFPAGTPRILMSGCPMAVPNWKLPWIVETSGAVIVGEESCVGERGTRNLVNASGSTRGRADGRHRGPLLPGRLRHLHAEPGPAEPRRRDGQGLQGRRRDPLRAAVLPALSDGSDPGRQGAGRQEDPHTAHRDRLQHGGCRPAQDPRRGVYRDAEMILCGV